MSRKIVTQFEVRDALIMKDTLRQLGHDFTEVSEEVMQINRAFNPIEINAMTGNITCDSANTSEVDNIKQAYTLNFYRDQALKEGMQIQEETLNDGRVVLRLTH